MIRAEQLSLRYGQSSMLFASVSFEIHEGRSLSLMGKSGSGKTSLIKILAGLLAPTSGKAEIDSKSLSVVFQKNALFDSLSAMDNLLLPLDLSLGITGKIARVRALDLLDRVGLLHAQSLLPHELSGGMQKRLALARALMIRPKVLLCDEPTAGLDPITSRGIADLIRTLQHEQKMTLFTVTADVGRAFQLGDEIALLSDGHWIPCGTEKEARESKVEAVRAFLNPREVALP